MESRAASRPLAEKFKGLYSKSEHIDDAVIDAFSEGASGGNPATVIVLPAFRDEKWMQSVATEFNLPVTCYLVKRGTKLVDGSWVSPEDGQVDTSTSLGSEAEADSGSNDSPPGASELKPSPAEEAEVKHVIHDYDIRWFSPTLEVDMCGHATLAAAYLLFETSLVSKKDSIIFHTKSSLLSVRTVGPKDGDAQSSTGDGRKTPAVDMIELNLPWITTTPSPLSTVEKLTQTLRSVEVIAVGTDAHKLVVELASREDLENLLPNMQELLNFDYDGLYATASPAPESGYDFVSRVFFPKLGVNEDPVCGSAHCALGPYWSTRLGKDSLLAFQASRRGGTLALQVDKKIGRVYIRGQATMVMAGVLLK